MSAVILSPQPFQVVKPEEIDLIWPHIESGAREALATSDGEATVEDTRTGLKRGATTLLIFERDGAWLGIVFQFLAFPRFKIARVLLAFGSKMATMESEMATAEAWAKDQGCAYVEAWVRTASRERLFARFGYKPTYRIIRKELA